jgi:DNA modification methylase
MSAPYYEGDGVTVYHGDCIEVMRSMPDASVHAVVTDPPYGLGFMGKAWDDLPPGLDFATEALRVLKPGGHMLAFGGTRTWHRLTVAVEDAGFEIRDSIAWLYGQGMPKSPNVGRLISELGDSAEAAKWRGYSAQLRPSFEPIVVARKSLAGTLAETVLAHNVGALNIDGCRFGGPSTSAALRAAARVAAQNGRTWGMDGIASSAASDAHWASNPSDDLGRWPTNAILDGVAADLLDAQAGVRNSGYGDTGFASRYFPTFRYEAKAPRSERPVADGTQHPTVKPLDLMRWLVRLVTPTGGTVLEPFAGSGTTLEAALIEGFNVIGIEREDTYLPLIMQRITKPLQQSLFSDDVAETPKWYPAYDEVRSSGWSGAEEAFDLGGGVS